MNLHHNDATVAGDGSHGERFRGLRKLRRGRRDPTHLADADPLGDHREFVSFTDPQTALIGVTADRFSATVSQADIAGVTDTRADAEAFLTLLSDGERLTGAYAFGPEAGEWMQMLALAIRARVPLDVVIHTIRPFPSLVRVYVAAHEALIENIAAVSEPVGARSTGEPGSGLP